VLRSLIREAVVLGGCARSELRDENDRTSGLLALLHTCHTSSIVIGTAMTMDVSLTRSLILCQCKKYVEAVEESGIGHRRDLLAGKALRDGCRALGAQLQVTAHFSDSPTHL
jgi:hypothetical protein